MALKFSSNRFQGGPDPGASPIYSFGPFRVDAGERLIQKDGNPVPVTPRAFETLLVLIENRGRLVTKDLLMKTVWGDTVVEESTLSQNIFTLRKLLGEDSGRERRYIETVPKLGYRFVANVTACTSSPGEDEAVREASRSTGDARAINISRTRPTPILTRRLIFIVPLAPLLAGAVVLLLIGHTPPGARPAIETLAVLPFKPVDQVSQPGYLEFGIADSLIMKFSATNRIVVRPISSVRRYSGLESDPLAAGRDLGVDAVLDGTIQEAEGRIRVNARLLGVRDGRAIWAGKFDAESANLLDVQDSISEQIAGALNMKLTGEERGLLGKRYTRDPEAYDLYQKGRFFWNKRTPEGLQTASQYFQRAISKDPSYALAYSGLADSYTLLDLYTGRDLGDAFEKSRAAAEKALDLDASLAAPHASLAYIHYYYDWNWDEAEKEFRKAILLDPNYATGHQWYAEYLFYMSRFDESISEITHARELDPVSLSINTEMGSPYFYMRRYDKALELYGRAIEMDKSFPLANYCVALSYCQQGKYEQALDLLNEYSDPSAMLAYTYAVSGHRREAARVLSHLNAASAGQFSPYLLATVHAALGEKDLCFALLDRAYQARDERLVMLKVDPHLDSVRDDPRFHQMLRRIGLDEPSKPGN